MFTGIIATTSTIENLCPLNSGFELRVQVSAEFGAEIEAKSNVAIDGRVLTVSGKSEKENDSNSAVLSFYLSSIKDPKRYERGRRVNLERAIRAGEEIPGFLFSGVPSGQGQVVSLEPIEGDRLKLEIRWENALMKYLSVGDQVCMDGVLLRIKEIEGAAIGFELYHPDALQLTNLPDRKAGDSVNIEMDPVTKKVGQIMEKYFTDASAR